MKQSLSLGKKQRTWSLVRSAGAFDGNLPGFLCRCLKVKGDVLFKPTRCLDWNNTKKANASKDLGRNLVLVGKERMRKNVTGLVGLQTSCLLISIAT